MESAEFGWVASVPFYGQITALGVETLAANRMTTPSFLSISSVLLVQIKALCRSQSFEGEEIPKILKKSSTTEPSYSLTPRISGRLRKSLPLLYWFLPVLRPDASAPVMVNYLISHIQNHYTHNAIVWELLRVLQLQFSGLFEFYFIVVTVFRFFIKKTVTGSMSPR